VASIMADAIIEGRKRFLSYLSQEGVAIKEKKEAEEEQPVLLPEEEIKIKEIEEIVETTEPAGEEVKAVKKVRPGKAQEEKAKIKRKA